MGGYIGAAARSGVRLLAKHGSILSAFDLDGAFVDSCGYAGLLIDPSSGGIAMQISWQPSEHNCQSNGFCAITDIPALDTARLFKGAPGTLPSVVGLTVAGQFRAQVGPGIALSDARAVKIDVNARAWNLRGFYRAETSFDAFIVLGPKCRNVAINGLYGGGMNGEGGGQDAVALRHDRSAGTAAHINFGGTTGVDTTPEAELR